MRRLEYFVVCKSVSLDAMSGEISLFHVTQHRSVSSLPCVIPSLCAVASWIDEDTLLEGRVDHATPETHVKLNVISPGGNPVNTFRRTIGSQNRMQQSVFRVMNIPIPTEGDLVFELVVDDSLVAHHTVVVSQKGAHNNPMDRSGGSAAS